MASPSSSSYGSGARKRSMEKKEDQCDLHPESTSDALHFDSTPTLWSVDLNTPPPLGQELQEQVSGLRASGSEVLPLTKRNLHRLRKIQGSKKPSNTSTSGHSEQTSQAGDSEPISTSCSTDRQFEARLRENGVLQPEHSQDLLAPSNFDDLISQLGRTRTSPPPSENSYRTFTRLTESATNEAEMGCS